MRRTQTSLSPGGCGPGVLLSAQMGSSQRPGRHHRERARQNDCRLDTADDNTMGRQAEPSAASLASAGVSVSNRAGKPEALPLSTTLRIVGAAWADHVV